MVNKALLLIAVVIVVVLAFFLFDDIYRLYVDLFVPVPGGWQ